MSSSALSTLTTSTNSVTDTISLERSLNNYMSVPRHERYKYRYDPIHRRLERKHDNDDYYFFVITNSDKPHVTNYADGFKKVDPDNNRYVTFLMPLVRPNTEEVLRYRELATELYNFIVNNWIPELTEYDLINLQQNNNPSFYYNMMSSEFVPAEQIKNDFMKLSLKLLDRNNRELYVKLCLYDPNGRKFDTAVQYYKTSILQLPNDKGYHQVEVMSREEFSNSRSLSLSSKKSKVYASRNLSNPKNSLSNSSPVAFRGLHSFTTPAPFTPNTLNENEEEMSRTMRVRRERLTVPVSRSDSFRERDRYGSDEIDFTNEGSPSLTARRRNASIGSPVAPYAPYLDRYTSKVEKSSPSSPYTSFFDRLSNKPPSHSEKNSKPLDDLYIRSNRSTYSPLAHKSITAVVPTTPFANYRRDSGSNMSVASLSSYRSNNISTPDYSNLGPAFTGADMINDDEITFANSSRQATRKPSSPLSQRNATWNSIPSQPSNGSREIPIPPYTQMDYDDSNTAQDEDFIDFSDYADNNMQSITPILSIQQPTISTQSPSTFVYRTPTSSSAPTSADRLVTGLSNRLRNSSY